MKGETFAHFEEALKAYLEGKKHTLVHKSKWMENWEISEDFNKMRDALEGLRKSLSERDIRYRTLLYRMRLSKRALRENNAKFFDKGKGSEKATKYFLKRLGHEPKEPAFILDDLLQKVNQSDEQLIMIILERNKNNKVGALMVKVLEIMKEM